MKNIDDHLCIARQNEAIKLQSIIRAANLKSFTDNKLNKTENLSHPAFITIERLAAELKEYTFILYQDNNTPEACIAYKFNNEAVYLNRLSVIPESQGKGIATKLVKHIIALAKDNNSHYISIGINGADENLYRWYINQGFILHEKKEFKHISFPVYMLRYQLI